MKKVHIVTECIVVAEKAIRNTEQIRQIRSMSYTDVGYEYVCAYDLNAQHITSFYM